MDDEPSLPLARDRRRTVRRARVTLYALRSWAGALLSKPCGQGTPDLCTEGVAALMDAEGLRCGIHHIYDRLKRNKALPDHDGIGVAALDGHESHTSYLQHCAGCLERTIHGKDGKAD